MASLKRRSAQFNQLLFSDIIVDNNKNQKLIENRYSIDEEVNHYREIALSGFFPYEEKAISKLIQVYPKNSKILCIGGGCGREPFAFEKLGFTVTSLDTSQEMTKVGKSIGSQFESQVDFQCGNFLNWDSGTKYQIVFVSSVLINFIQGTDNRIKAFKTIHSLLDNGGLIIFETDVFENRTFSRYNLSSILLKFRLGKLWEKGDTVRSFFGNHTKDKRLMFYHHYLEKEEVYYELKESHFLGIGDRDELFWGIKK